MNIYANSQNLAESEAAIDRQVGRVETSIMNQARIVQIGVSRGLSSLLTLLRSGVRSVILIDNQTVEPENIGQTLYEMQHIGQAKVEAAKAMILARAPDAIVATYTARAQEIPELAAILADADAVKIGIDDPASMFELAGLAQHTGTPAFIHFMTGDGEQHATVFVSPDGPTLQEILPDTWQAVQAGYRPPDFFPSCALHTEVMNAAVAMMIAGYLHHRAGSTITQMSAIGAGIAEHSLAIGFNGYHEPSRFLMPIYFGHPE